jgi:hypothetical protein
MLTVLVQIGQKKWQKSPVAMIQAWLGGESNPTLPQPSFKHDRRGYLSDILSESCQCWQKKCDNSIQISWAYQKHLLGGEPLSWSHVSNPALPQPCFKHDRRSGCTCPIYYKGVVSVEKGSVIIRYRLAELIKKFLRRGAPLSRSHVSSMTMVESRTVLSRSHVSSMLGGWTCPIYY